MAFKEGETYLCPDAQCGSQITVTHSADPNCRGNQNLRRCCGKEMMKK